jgi:hypothetical protein
VIAIALIVPLLSGCGDTGNTTNADLLKQAVANMKAATSYAIDASFDQDGQNVKLSGEVDVANNNSKLQIDSGGQRATLITIGDDVYLSTDGGATYADTSNRGVSITQAFTGLMQLWNGFQTDQIDKHKDDLKDGKPAIEKINGMDTKHITGNAKSLSLAGSSSPSTTDGTVDFWVSTGTPYVMRMKLDGTIGGQPVQGTYSWDKFNQKFDIQAPPISYTQYPVAAAGR